MKKILLVFFCTLFVISSRAQMAKKSWLVGGSIGFSSKKIQSDLYGSTTNNIRLAGNAGYFVIDKLAVGLQPDMNLSFLKSFDGSHQSSSYSSLGPFLRYYLLPAVQKTNIFIESNYSIGIVKIQDLDAYHYQQFSFSAGPEVFLTPSAGLQFSVDYIVNKTEDDFYPNTNTLQVRVGFQFHF